MINDVLTDLLVGLLCSGWWNPASNNLSSASGRANSNLLRDPNARSTLRIGSSNS